MGKERHSADSPTAVFRTGFGLPMWLILSTFCLSYFNFAVLHGLGGVPVVFQVLAAAMAVLVFYLMLSTKYRVQNGVLEVRMGPFSRRIDIESISSVFLKGKTFRGRLYGLGTHLVGIDYEGGSVSITPKDIDGFLAAVGARRTESGDVARIG